MVVRGGKREQTPTGCVRGRCRGRQRAKAAADVSPQSPAARLT